MREIILWGEPSGSDQFEEELYSGIIRSDEEMRRRAQALGVHLRVRDDKIKVQKREGVLVGEVSDFERGVIRKRRLYVTTGRFALIEIEGEKFSRVQWGEAGRFVVLGGPFIQHLANRCIQDRWKGGGFHEALRLITEILQVAARYSPSVSPGHMLIQTVDTIDLEPVLKRDRLSATKTK